MKTHYELKGHTYAYKSIHLSLLARVMSKATKISIALEIAADYSRLSRAPTLAKHEP